MKRGGHHHTLCGHWCADAACEVSAEGFCAECQALADDLFDEPETVEAS